jgi:protein-S-isoprenylcysteine O-methyltransferase Ste14
VAIVLVIFLLTRLKVFQGHPVTTDPWLQGIGLAVFVLGLALAAWARIYLGRNWGMPMFEKVDPELVTTGPYRTVRHPIVPAMIGTAIAVSVYWPLAIVLLGVYFIYSAFMEERRMAQVFPDTFPA